MDGNKYQELALRTANKLENENLMIMATLGLAGETGEYADMIKKFLYHGKALNFGDALKELGDIAWYLAVAANSLGFTLNEVLEANINKLSKRYPEGFSKEASEARVDIQPEREKVYSCGYCLFATTDGQEYDDHLSTIHPLPDEAEEEPKIGYGMPKTVHAEIQKFKCKGCEMVFATQFELDAHNQANLSYRNARWPQHNK